MTQVQDKDDESRLEKETLWIIDPLDGTSDFIDKTGEFTIMIALIKKKKPVLGIINWPTENTLFVAQIGKGAYRYSNENWMGQLTMHNKHKKIKSLQQSWGRQASLRICQLEMTTTAKHVSKIFAGNKADACVVQQKQYTGFCRMSVMANLLRFGCFSPE